MQRQTRGYMQGFETTADASTVWRALTEPAALKRWLATAASVEPRTGGRYLVETSLFGRREAIIERFEPGMRLSLLYESNPETLPLSDTALVEDFFIDENRGRRKLRVIGSGVPEGDEWLPLLKRLRTGWALSFARLEMRLRTGEMPDAAA